MATLGFSPRKAVCPKSPGWYSTWATHGTKKRSQWSNVFLAPCLARMPLKPTGSPRYCTSTPPASSPMNPQPAIDSAGTKVAPGQVEAAEDLVPGVRRVLVHQRADPLVDGGEPTPGVEPGRVALGSSVESPFQSLAFLALSVIPSLKITDRGLVDVDRFELVPLEA